MRDYDFPNAAFVRATIGFSPPPEAIEGHAATGGRSGWVVGNDRKLLAVANGGPDVLQFDTTTGKQLPRTLQDFQIRETILEA